MALGHSTRPEIREGRVGRADVLGLLRRYRAGDDCLYLQAGYKVRLCFSFSYLQSGCIQSFGILNEMSEQLKSGAMIPGDFCDSFVTEANII